MRQIVLDTETTGLETSDEHRIIEIGCVELINRRITRNHYHVYLNPDRAVDQGAFEVHGISDQFLRDKPRFHDIIEDLLKYLSGAELIIHNAPFDVGFLDYEFQRYAEARQQTPTTIAEHCSVVDSLVMARDMYPGQRNSLDALCKRLEVDNSQRELHGALLDAEILAEVYLMMTGGQGSLLLEPEENSSNGTGGKTFDRSGLVLPILAPNADELAAHKAYLERMRDKEGSCLWDAWAEEPPTVH